MYLLLIFTNCFLFVADKFSNMLIMYCKILNALTVIKLKINLNYTTFEIKN